jgi:hypothetical protein
MRKRDRKERRIPSVAPLPHLSPATRRRPMGKAALKISPVDLILVSGEEDWG